MSQTTGKPTWLEQNWEWEHFYSVTLFLVSEDSRWGCDSSHGRGVEHALSLGPLDRETGIPKPGSWSSAAPCKGPKGTELQGDGKEILHHPLGPQCQTPGRQAGPRGLLWSRRRLQRLSANWGLRASIPRQGRCLLPPCLGPSRLGRSMISCLGEEKKVKRKSAWWGERAGWANTC